MENNHSCQIGDFTVGTGKLSVIAGPCMAESYDLCLEVATELKQICTELDINFAFKASFDKANRSSVESYRGPGIADGLAWLGDVRSKLGVPVVTDIHETQQAAVAGEVVDCLQIPAFLSRQTDLLVAAGNTGKAVNVKKGQFMAPDDMSNVVEKIRSTGNQNVLVTDRGTFFGYNRLVTDFRCIPLMSKYAPTCFDATHSVQEPGGLGTASGGQRQFAPLLAYAAMSVGADALFIETHPEPAKAKSDAACQIPLDQMKQVLAKCKAHFDLAKS